MLGRRARFRIKENRSKRFCSSKATPPSANRRSNVRLDTLILYRKTPFLKNFSNISKFLVLDICVAFVLASRNFVEAVGILGYFRDSIAGGAVSGILKKVFSRRFKELDT